MRSHRKLGRVVRATAAGNAAITLLAMSAVGVPVAAQAAAVTNGRIYYSTAALLPDPDPTTPSQVWSVNPNGTGKRQLTHVAAPARAGGPDVSPNGRRVLYVSSVAGPFQVWMMRADGTHQHRVVHDPEHDAFVPRWSPDGTHLLYTRCSTTFGFSECRIAVARTDGTGLHDLTGGRWLDFSAAYSPNGQTVTFSGDRGGLVTAIWRMPTAGGALHRLTPAAPEDWWPDYRPDGGRILFGDNADRPLTNVWSMDPDGTHVTQLTHLTDPNKNLAFARYSPDGKHIVADYIDGTSDWLVSLNADGSGLTKIVKVGTPDNLTLADWGASS